MADNGRGEVADGIHVKNNISEPTMGEKLANLNLLDNNKSNSAKDKESSLAVKPSSADSAYVMFKQALHTEDHALVLDCLYTQDEKVIAKSISLLNPSHVEKLLHSLISIIRSRGAVLACAFPWLRCVLIQRTSGIMSQQSSSLVLNSLCQLIESRVSTLQSALQVSSVLDLIYTEINIPQPCRLFMRTRMKVMKRNLMMQWKPTQMRTMKMSRNLKMVLVILIVYVLWLIILVVFKSAGAKMLFDSGESPDKSKPVMAMTRQLSSDLLNLIENLWPRTMYHRIHCHYLKISHLCDILFWKAKPKW